MKYPLSLRLLHWLMALLILTLLALGLYMTGLERGDPHRADWYSLHKSLGVTVLALACLRVGVRLFSFIPPLPPEIPRAEAWLAHLGHLALYGFMFLLPLSGYIMSNSFGLSVHWFGVTLPRIVSPDRPRGTLASDIHTYGAYALMGMIALHVLAVLLHWRRQRINLLSRML